MNQLKEFRYYQKEADDAINEELIINNKCIVKMFCGTGKSLLMRKCKYLKNKNLVVYVFPSLALIDQFCNDYFVKVGLPSPFKISSENDSTTDPDLIKAELKKKKNKIFCVTYQSYKTLLDNLGSTKINVCIYDEAHKAVGETYQKLIFENETNACEKQIFFTATPKNANGIIMYDRNNLEAGMCGKLVYDYSYLRGLSDGYVNPFEIRVDMYTEKSNKSVYESIARAILVSGNNRVLTFHADVNTERDASVINFVKEPEFIRAFMKVLTNEFPEKAGAYTKFKMIALDANVDVKCNSCRLACENNNYFVNSKNCCRHNILNRFDTTLDNEVYIISSCETIGEGIDTKNANMCVFVDPKSSFVKIIQNIGRIIRPQSKQSTVLIPCWVDKEKYVGCDKDRDKCDDVIRSDLNKEGNFNGILNVLSALRQEDEDLYDICLHYPDTYSPKEIRSNLEKHGYKVLDPVGDGELIETMEYLLDEEIDYDNYEDCDTNEEIIMRIAEDNDVCVEIHTNSFENQIEKYNSECDSGEIIRLYKEEEDEEGNQLFCPIVKKCGKRKSNGSIKGLERKDRIKIDVHTNPDVKVLWKLEGDFTKDICSCVLECEVDVVDRWFERFEELKKFINENERIPNNSSKKNDEKRIGDWFTDQKRNYKNNERSMKDTVKNELWTQYMGENPQYFKTDDDYWFEYFEELKNFISENERIPTEISERKLARWFQHQKQNFKNKSLGMKNETRYNIWKQFMNENPQYFMSDEDYWNSIFIKLKKFIKENNKLPSRVSNNKNEINLNSWLNTQRSAFKQIKYGMKNEIRYSIWEHFLYEYKQYFKDYEDVWYNKLEDLKKFINENKRKPSKEPSDKTEQILGQWLGQQLNNYKTRTKSMSFEDRCKKFEEFMAEYSEYFIDNNSKWFENFKNAKNFIIKNTKIPSQKSDDEEEKKYGTWVSHQHKNYKTKRGCMSNIEIYDIWTNFVTEYRYLLLDNNEKWYNTLKTLKDFIYTNKRLPSFIYNDETENKLLKWYYHQKENFKDKKENMKDGHKYNAWEKFMEEFKDYLSKNYDEVWYSHLKELQLFITTFSKLPLEDATNEEEKKLGKWSCHQKQQYKNKNGFTLNPEKLEAWETFIKNNIIYLKPNYEIWLSKLDELRKFIKEKQKLPAYSSKNNIEKYLGQWLSTQKQNYKNKTENMKDEMYNSVWKSFITEYDIYFKDDWYDNYDALIEFIEKNNKLPRSKSNDVNEKQIGVWLHNQNPNYKEIKGSMKDKDKYNLWKEMIIKYKECFKTDQEKWNEKLDELKIFINENKRKPSNKNENEKQLLKWLYHQTENYKSNKNSMKDPEIYIKWSQFLEEYKQYFDNTTDNIQIEEIIITPKPKKETKPKEKTNKPNIKLVIEDSEDEEEYILKPKKSTALQRQMIVPNKTETCEQKKTRTKNELSSYHQKYITMRSDTLATHFKNNPTEFETYHKIRDDNLNTFKDGEKPHELVIQSLSNFKTKTQKTIVDMGCGLAKIANHFANDKRYNFINYDHVSVAENITVCDISNMPLENDSSNICIMSFALWGPNCADYIKEAHRVLETQGTLHIVDSTKRWSEKNENNYIEKEMECSKIKKMLENSGFKIVQEKIDKFCYFICLKI